MSHTFILTVQEQRRPDVVHELKVHFFNTIMDIKRMLEAIVSFPAERLRILLSSTMQVLKNSQVLSKLSLPVNEPALILSYGFGKSGGYVMEGAKGISYDTDTRDMLRQVQQGLNKSVPGKTDAIDCTGGVYFMKSVSGSIVGVFKPQDEEQGMMNNPKGHAGNGTQGLRPFFKPGDGYLREYAAYLLDFENFCKIPATTIASCEHPIFSYANDEDKETYPKVGSLQRYIRSNDTFEDISPSLLSAFEVQKIALLDMRLLNSDRNSANILAVRKDHSAMTERRGSRGESLSSVGELNDTELDVLDFIAGSSHFKESSRPLDTYELIPIDHGYCLPTRLQIDEFDWAWYYSPQVAQPVDPRIKAYLNRLNFDELIAKVTAEVSLSEDTIFLLRTVHELLVQGINDGLTLFDIASLIARVEDGVPSPLEKAIARAEESAYSTIEVREGHRFSKAVAISENNSPVRRGKSPMTILSSTPPRVSELLKMKRMVKSEIFQDSTTDDGDLRTSRHFSDEPTIPKSSLLKQDDDYFVKDLEGGHSPKPPTVKPSVLFTPSFALQGEELRTMKTLDSSGLSLFFKSQKRATEESKPTEKVVYSGEPSPVGKADRFGDYYEGLTNSEASSYESIGHSPRSFLDSNFISTTRVPTMSSPTFYPTQGDQQPRIDGCPSMRMPSNVDLESSHVDRNRSFDALEVRTFQPMVFEKSSVAHVSSTTVDDGYDTNIDTDQASSMGSTPSERMFEQLYLSAKSKQDVIASSAFSTDNLQMLPMARVSSFNALESPPLYSAAKDLKSVRLMQNLRREKRKSMSKSAEFPALRQQFADTFIKKLLTSARLRAGSM